MLSSFHYSCSSSLILKPFLHLQPKTTHNPLIITFYDSSQPPRKRPTSSNEDNSSPKPTSTNRHKRTYDASRRSILKTLKQEQVTFTSPAPDDPIVAIIGGGMAGLACALSVQQHGVRSTVFDIVSPSKWGSWFGRKEGRMGTRMVEPQPLVFDHAAQFFTASDPRFVELIKGWMEQGLVKEWRGTVGELEVGGKFVPLPSSPLN